MMYLIPESFTVEVKVSTNMDCRRSFSFTQMEYFNIYLSNFSFLQEECEVIFGEVPADPDLDPGPGLADEVLAVLVLRGLVHPDGGDAGGARVSVEQGRHHWPGV